MKVMPSCQNQIFFHPIISCIQKVNLYEEKKMFYLIGSNNTTSLFRVIKIDRTDPKELTVVDDGVQYNINEVRKLVEKIEIAHARHSHRAGASAKIHSAYGVVGFVKFTEGYYIILVTKRQQVATIGHHMIYKIKDTCFVYIPQDVARCNSPIEQRYIKLFQSIDLSSNFYFSYSYDLTHTLQYNLAPPSDFPLSAFQLSPPPTEESLPKQRTLQENLHFGVRYKPNSRFVWNWFLLKPVINVVHPDWILYMIHGFLDQSNINVFGRSFYVTLIARRSRKYAGTRFLKRGANFEGDVANEVETEQMVHDASVPSFAHGRFTSFVQMRGSVPGHWSQDVSKMVPKPQISIDISDPFGETSGKHFNQLLRRYGAPIIILNLVKKREAKRQESVLSEELIRNVRYLNQFLPPKYHIRYTSFDMARMNKTKDINVMQRLADIARSCVLKTGIFVSKPLRNFGNDWAEVNFRPRYQRGVVRVNCVDCLDRTNTAQFAVGRWALGAQLCALGVLLKPTIEFDTDCIRILEALYEDHGDTLALQYGGSQLVHRIETYRKTAPWTSQGNDIMQTLSRYYSNTFSDADKQNAINLFLGIFTPEKGLHIWEYLSDYHLHQSRPIGISEPRLRPLTQWWDPEILPYLPRAYEEQVKVSSDICASRPDDEAVDGFVEYHRPHEVTIFKEIHAFKISHSIRDFMPNFTTDFSPFAVRVRPGRLREESGKAGVKNPSLTGQSSTSSTASSGTSSSEASEDSLSEDDFDEPTESRGSRQEDEESGVLLFQTLFPPMAQVYGTQPEPPSKSDLITYKKYQKMYTNCIGTVKPTYKKQAPLLLSGSSRITNDSDFCTSVPSVSTASTSKYQEYILRALQGASSPSQVTLDVYKKYVGAI